MKPKKLILELALIAGLSLISPKGIEQKSMEISYPLNKIESIIKQKKAKEKENIFYYSPFRNTKNEVILPLENSAKINVNYKAQEFLDKTLNEASKIYEKEKRMIEQNQNLLYLIQEYNSELIDQEKREERILLNKSRGISVENSKWVNGMKIYSPDDPVYQKHIKNYLDSLEYFGNAFLDSTHLFYNPKKAKELMENGLRPIDCTSFVLEAISRGQEKNFHRKILSDASLISKFLKKREFEIIYFAENTLDTSKQYFYGINEKFHTGSFIKKIKKGEYKFPVDYIVTDSSFRNPLFKEFIEESPGFVFLQEGVHLGFLDKGNFIDAHNNADPRNTSVFTSRKFYELMNNDNPKVDYQSAVLCVPRGTVKKFLYDNKCDIRE